MRREIRIFADKHTDNQVITENSKTEAHSNPLWSVDSRGAGQYVFDTANRWKCHDNYTAEILQEVEFDRVKISKLGTIQSLSQNEVEVKIKANIY